NPGRTLVDYLLCKMAFIRHAIGFTNFQKSSLYPENAAGKPLAVKHESLYLLDRLADSGIISSKDYAEPVFDIELTEQELTASLDWLNGHRKYRDKILVAIAPGCNQPANQWDIENFCELGARLIKDYPVELVIVGGGDDDMSAAQYLLNTWGAGIDATHGFSPRQSAAIISHCQLFIGLDSGPLHLAFAAGTPTVSLFSDRDNPGRWHPLGEKHKVIRKSVACGGCRKSICPVPGHHCMTDIHVTEVLDVAANHINTLVNQGVPL
ncbi:MAG TPA: glycosyltransferase family 9 protein, partial [Gammaproteobacteria bacterium]|nr:glycosyltransferase family 9 protein [Gammaproteobacteria bacterium]